MNPRWENSLTPHGGPTLQVSNSEFAYIGGNAVAAWGYTNETDTDPGRPGIRLANAPAAGVDGTDGEHPLDTTIVNNSAREVGLYEKQSSFYVQARREALLEAFLVTSRCPLV